MATRNIVPRATGEGQIGTSAKTWSAGYFNDIAVTNGVSASTFTGDLTGDVTGDLTGNVTGDVTGDLTGNVTGDVTGDLTGNVTGATSVAFTTQGEVGFRGTTHTEPAEVCKQVIVTAGSVDSEWIDGNAKLALHTYDSTETNTAENGSFVLQADDGTDAPFLEGKPNGSLTWANKEVERVNSSGSTYIRYESGLQICWDTVTITPSSSGEPFAHSGSATVTFPVAFSSAPLVFANINENAGYWNALCQAQSTTGATISIGGYNANQHNAQYFAVGKWK